MEPNENYSTILKVPGFASLHENNSKGTDLIEVEIVQGNIIKYHGFECRFYEEVCPFFKDLPIPKVFKTVKWILNQQEGCIHMEDLSPKGKVMEFCDSLNLAQVKDVVKTLAKMHKQLWTMDQKIWKDKFLENQLNFGVIIDAIMKSMDSMEEMAKGRFGNLLITFQIFINF